MMKQSGESTIVLKTIILLFVWVPCSESRPLATSSRYRERRDAIHFEDFDADAVPVISNNAYEKAPDTDFILQTGLSRNLDDERRNIQPRRISGFALINFASDSAYSATTPKPETTVVNPFTLSSSVTFSNLVERARQQYGQTPSFQPQTDPSGPSTVTSTPTSIFSGSSTQKTHPSFKDSSSSRSISRYRGQNYFRSKKRPQISQYRIDQLRKTTNRFIRRRYRVHASPTTPTTSMPTTPEATTTLPPPTTVPSPPQIFTNVETASAYLVTRNVSSTRVVTEATVPIITTEAISGFETTISSRKQRQNDEAYSQTYDYYYSDAPTTLDYEESESTRTTPMPSTTSTPPLSTTTEMTTTENVPFTTNWPPGLETSDRSPRTSDVDTWGHEDDNQHIDREEETIFSGKYFEESPGKYLENNPGQYFEENPGQYYEENPGKTKGVNRIVVTGQTRLNFAIEQAMLGVEYQSSEENRKRQYYDAPYAGQYQEVSPGQYHETNPGQYNDNLDVQVVKVKHLNDAQVYNVQSKVDNFIIGEYGTISKNDGQTIQGVRYTAVDDQSIDPKIIYETLQKYFPMVQFDEDER